MAIKVKSKKPPKGAGRPKKKTAARHVKKARSHSGAAAAKHVTPTKTLLARKPAHKTHAKKPFVRKAPTAEAIKSVLTRKPKRQREFVVSAEPVSAQLFPSKKKKKKHQTVLRFTENTLKDIAALECVRRCFR